VWITLDNMKARPQKYESGDQLLKWWAPSKNMFIIGGMIFIFLILHLFNFWVKIKITGDELLGTSEEMHNTYALVSNLFIHYPLYDFIYVLSGIFVGLHMSHGFWSAFQTIGLNNIKWMKRLKCLANLIGFVFAIGFASIPIYFLIKF
jgi:succinate dehydrogenase / fumarate reductase cytochrome b subunit